MKDRIVAAAIRKDDSGAILSTPRPLRHHDIIHSECRQGREVVGRVDHFGFITSDGKFVGRETAASIAHEAGQIGALKPLLYTNDLW